MVEPVRHRQTKGAATDMFDLQPPRHTSTLPITDLGAGDVREILEEHRFHLDVWLEHVGGRAISARRPTAPPTRGLVPETNPEPDGGYASQ